MADDGENANAYILDLRDGILLISIASVCHEKNILLWRKTPPGGSRDQNAYGLSKCMSSCDLVCGTSVSGYMILDTAKAAGADITEAATK